MGTNLAILGCPSLSQSLGDSYPAHHGGKSRYAIGTSMLSVFSDKSISGFGGHFRLLVIIR